MSRAVDAKQLSRCVSHALRHEPWVYELELDHDGWVDVDQLVESLRTSQEEFRFLCYSDLERMIQESSKQRHELQGKRIRAMYGHSLTISRTRTNLSPPAVLFHGTSESAFKIICNEGLKPMGRQQVHLSVDLATAWEVGRRKAALPVIAEVQALRAHSGGIEFYRGNEMVWLADVIPPEYVRRTQRGRR